MVMRARSLVSLSQEKDKSGALEKIALLLNNPKELDVSLKKLVELLSGLFSCPSVRLSYGNEVYLSSTFVETPSCESFSTEISGKQTLQIDFFFADKETHLVFTEEAKTNTRFFTLVLNLCAGAISRNLLERILFEHTERNKELKGINRTTEILEKTDHLEESLQEICYMLPEAWQYPEYTAVRIIYEDKVFTSGEFEETPWVQRESFYTPNNRKGVIEVFYLKEFPDVDEGPFLLEERNLLINLSNLIAGSATKEMFKKLSWENTERLKELNGINQVSSIIEKDISIEDTLQKICNMIPKSWQYPEYTCAKITYEGRNYFSKNFKETVWFQKENFVTLDNKKGTIQVCYLKKFPDADEGPFLKEESQLLINLGKLISGFINNYKGRDIYNKKHTKLPVVHKSDDFRKSLTKDKQPLQLFFNKQVLDKYIYLDMMKYKVKNILFVATLYDAFILENEDSFFEQFMGEIYQYSLFSLPRITGVTTPAEALDLLKTTHFDLVILMVGIDNEAPISLSKEIKRKRHNLPIYLLLNEKSNVKYFEELVPTINSIDNIFVWNGNSQILFAIVKSIEDRTNVDNDTKIGLVRVILLIEDSALYYSRYLQNLYSIVFGQVQQLLSDTERNEINKISKMRSRPKVLHARNYEDAMFIYEKYKDFLLCVISDVEFDRNGKLDKSAGIKFVKYVKKQAVTLPIILQSSDSHNEQLAKDLGVSFINKDSESLLADLKNFLTQQLGFGDFVFRNKEGKPLATARTLKEFQSILKYIPEESLYAQGIENQFSLWFMSRGEIQLAKTINPVKVTDFETMEDFRQYFLKTVTEYKENKRKGKILNFDEVAQLDEKNIVSMSSGSSGGKGRGLAFINTLIYNLDFSRFSKEINIRTPITAIIGTDEFESFMERNDLYKLVFNSSISYLEIRERFLKAKLSDELQIKLERFILEVKKPIAVRSSSLSEDSITQAFAGVFDTYVVPNNDEDVAKNLEQIAKAIKLVYASVYSEDSRTYFKAIHHRVEDERMAIVLQELVGSYHENYYYPHLSGTAQSYNYYPVAHMKPEEGFAVAAMGLGYYVVGGRKSFRFSPRYPNIDVFTTKDMLRSTQINFFAVDLSRKEIDYLNEGEHAPLTLLEISEAEKHGTIKHCVSVYNAQNDNIEPGLSCAGPRIINFANILKYDYIPLAELIDELLSIAKDALGSPIEIEWAVDLSKTTNNLPSFYLLQIKPTVSSQLRDTIVLPKVNKAHTVLYTESSLGNGKIDDITDVIYIDPNKFDKMKTLDIVKEIEYLNNIMLREDRKYILIGPGRWGTRDQFLGVPVSWSQISNAKVIVEISLPNFPLDSSLGSHFFYNVSSMNIGYFSVQDSSLIDFVNWSILDKQNIVNETEYVKHIRFTTPMTIYMNGKERKAIINM
jgi:hypothetical protein